MTDKEQERRSKLKASLPHMKGDYNPPDYVQIKVKNDHFILKFVGIIALIAAIVVVFCNFMFVKVDGHSMDPTLQTGHYFLAKRHEKPERFEIAVLKERTTDNGPSKTIVKRIIGLPGDQVSVINGRLFINNKEYSEKYLAKKNITYFKKLNWTIKVPKNHVFVLGDNRDISKDSRSVGSFEMSSIMGIKI